MPLRPTSWLTSSHRPKNVPRSMSSLRQLEPGQGAGLDRIDPQGPGRAGAQIGEGLLGPGAARYG